MIEQFKLEVQLVLHNSWENFGQVSSPYLLISSNQDGRITITATWVCNVRKEKIIGKQNIFNLTGSFLFQPITFYAKVTVVQKICESFHATRFMLWAAKGNERYELKRNEIYMSYFNSTQSMDYYNAKIKTFLVFSTKWLI